MHVVKPNRAELQELVGRPLPSTADVVAAARALIEHGVALVVVSLGADGALFVDRETALAAALPAKKALSTVGAGDAMVAGIAAALVEGAPLERLARLAVAFATSKLDRIGPYLGPKRRRRTPRRRRPRDGPGDLISRFAATAGNPARRKVMSNLIAVVAATDRPTQATLAAEALKKAAIRLGHSLARRTESGRRRHGRSSA